LGTSFELSGFLGIPQNVSFFGTSVLQTQFCRFKSISFVFIAINNTQGYCLNLLLPESGLFEVCDRRKCSEFYFNVVPPITTIAINPSMTFSSGGSKVYVPDDLVRSHSLNICRFREFKSSISEDQSGFFCTSPLLDVGSLYLDLFQAEKHFFSALLIVSEMPLVVDLIPKELTMLSNSVLTLFGKNLHLIQSCHVGSVVFSAVDCVLQQCTCKLLHNKNSSFVSLSNATLGFTAINMQYFSTSFLIVALPQLSIASVTPASIFYSFDRVHHLTLKFNVIHLNFEAFCLFQGHVSPLIEMLLGEFSCSITATVAGRLPLVIVDRNQNQLSLPFNVQSNELPRTFKIYPEFITVGSDDLLEFVCEGCSKLITLQVGGREFLCEASSDYMSFCSIRMDVAGKFDLTCTFESYLVPCGILFVHDCPEISSIIPASSLIGHQSLVTLFGRNFIPASNLSCIWGSSWSRHHYGDHLLTRAVWLSVSSISCVVPSTTIGNITVHVSLNGFHKCASFLSHSIALPPSLLKVWPSSSSHLGGLPVTIFGNGFAGHSSGLVCAFGDTHTVARVVNNSVATCVTAAHSVGRVRLSVGVSGSADSSGGQVSFDFTSSAVHYCDSIIPNVVSAHGLSQVTIYGHGFDSHSRCRMSQTLVESAFLNSTAVLCNLGALSIGRHHLVVVNMDTRLDCEVLWIQVVPAAVVLSANNLRVHDGFSALITVIGIGFVETSALSCFIGRERSAVAEYLNSTAVVCAFHSDLLTSSKILVGVSNTETCSFNCSIFVDVIGAAVVTHANPSSGFSRGGQRITLSGRSLQSSTLCAFDGVTSPVVDFGLSSSWIVCLLPTGFQGGYVRVWVLPHGHLSGSVSFRILPIGRVVSVMPTLSVISGGSLVTVYGQELSVDGSEVTCLFGNVSLDRSSRVIDSGTIECVVPPSSVAGVIELRLQLSLQDVHWGHVSYVYVDAPVVSMIIPSFGPSSGGTSVSVIGAGFTEILSSSWSINVFRMGQTLTSSCSARAPDTLLCFVPATFQEGNWSVSVCEGDLCSVASFCFEYLPTQRKLHVLTPVVEALSGRSVVVSVQVSSAAFCNYLLCRIGLSSAKALKNCTLRVQGLEVVCVVDEQQRLGKQDLSIEYHAGGVLGELKNAFTVIPALSCDPNFVSESGISDSESILEVAGVHFVEGLLCQISGFVAASVDVNGRAGCAVMCRVPGIKHIAFSVNGVDWVPAGTLRCRDFGVAFFVTPSEISSAGGHVTVVGRGFSADLSRSCTVGRSTHVAVYLNDSAVSCILTAIPPMTVGVAVSGGNFVPLKVVQMNLVSRFEPSFLFPSETPAFVHVFGYFSSSELLSCSAPCRFVEYVSSDGIRCSVVTNVTSSSLEFQVFSNQVFVSSISIPVHRIVLKPLSSHLTFKGGKVDLAVQSDIPVSNISVVLCGLTSSCQMRAEQYCTLHVHHECSYGSHGIDVFLHSHKFGSEYVVISPLPVVSRLEPSFLSVPGHIFVTVHGENFEFFKFGASCRI
jgi:hypothetical protein